MNAAVLRQWVVSVRRRHAAACMTHVLCELLMRLRAVGPVEDHAFELALTRVIWPMRSGSRTRTSTGCSRVPGTRA